MKQLKTLVLSLPFVLAAVGCSQDELLPDGGTGTSVPEGLHEVEATFNMGTSGGLQTRSTTRPVISSDDWQRVTNVRIYVFKAENANASDDAYYYQPNINDGKGYLYVSNFADTKKDWGEDEVWGDDENEQENEAYTYSAKLQLEPGYYKFLAVGRDDIDEEGAKQSPAMTVPDWSFADYPSTIQNLLGKKAIGISGISDEDDSEDESKFFYDFDWEIETSLEAATVIVPHKTSVCTELFVGTSDVCPITESTSGFSTRIEMSRAVTGLLMYVKNIPQYVEAMENIQEYSKKGWSTVIKKGTSCKVERVCILAARSNYEIMMNTREVGNSYEVNENVIEYYTAITVPDDLEDQTIVDGCYTDKVLSGAFLCPQLAHKGGYENKEDMFNKDEKLDKSLYLVYLTTPSDKNRKYPIWWKPIKITGYQAPNGEDEYYYSLKANNFYSFGNRNYYEDEQGNKEKGDKPIDLKPKKDSEENLVITVNPDWDWKGDLEWAD